MYRRRSANTSDDEVITIRVPLNRYAPKNGEYFELPARRGYLKGDLKAKLEADFWDAPASREYRDAASKCKGVKTDLLTDPNATPKDFGGWSDQYRGYKATAPGVVTVWYHYAPTFTKRTGPFSRRVGKA